MEMTFTFVHFLHTIKIYYSPCTAYSGELLSPMSVTKTGYTGFWLVSDINRRKLVTSSENSERETSSVRYQRIQIRKQGRDQELGGRMEGFIQDGNEYSTKLGSLIQKISYSDKYFYS